MTSKLLRFKVGDKSTGVEIVSISEGMYHMLCNCERMFSRGINMENIPLDCRLCAADRATGVKKTTTNGHMVRPMNTEENDMIAQFQSGQC